MSPGTLITVAPTGAEHAKRDVPALPVTLEELVATAVECERLGAAVIHVHVRDGAGAPTLDPAVLRDTVHALRQETALVVQLSTGGAVSDPEPARLAVLNAMPDAASCTLGTVNFGDEVFTNRWPFVVALHRAMCERGILAEYEIFDLGHVATLRRLLDEHGPPAGGHVHADLVMGVPGGMPGDIATLVAAAEALARVDAAATFSATGVGRTHMSVALAALSAGGHLRVGLEDTLNIARGRRASGNAELVARAAELARLAGRPPLSGDEARALLGAEPR